MEKVCRGRREGRVVIIIAITIIIGASSEHMQENLQLEEGGTHPSSSSYSKDKTLASKDLKAGELDWALKFMEALPASRLCNAKKTKTYHHHGR